MAKNEWKNGRHLLGIEKISIFDEIIFRMTKTELRVAHRIIWKNKNEIISVEYSCFWVLFNSHLWLSITGYSNKGIAEPDINLHETVNFVKLTLPVRLQTLSQSFIRASSYTTGLWMNWTFQPMYIIWSLKKPDSNN
jgi:hypothetical protein